MLKNTKGMSAAMFWKKKKPLLEAPAKPSREEILAQAKANAAAARAEIGEETLDKIRDAIVRRQQSNIEQAKAHIKRQDTAKVADHIQFMLRHE